MWTESSKGQITFHQVVDTKKDPLISASASLPLHLVTLNVKNDQVNDKIHDNKKITKRKTNGNILPKMKTLQEYEDVFDTLGCLPELLPLEVNESIQPI